MLSDLNNPLSIPNYVQAVERETLVRDAGFLNLTESIGKFEVRQMTLRDYLVLKTMRSPLLFRAIPSPEQLAAFLWVLSPSYQPDAPRARYRFLRRCRAFVPKRPPLIRFPRLMARWEKDCKIRLELTLKLSLEAINYVKETMMDKPAQAATMGFEAPYFSIAAPFVSFMWRECGKDAMACSLKEIFQQLRESKQRNNSKEPLGNPSERVIQEELDRRNLEMQRN